jgi:hypothetical protein
MGKSTEQGNGGENSDITVIHPRFTEWNLLNHCMGKSTEQGNGGEKVDITVIHPQFTEWNLLNN